MISITRKQPRDTTRPRRASLPALTVATIEGGDLQEGQELDFKREVHLDKGEGRSRLCDDVVAFLNRGAGRLLIGIEEKGGRFDSFRPLDGNADRLALKCQTLLQDCILPVPVDVQVVPIHLESGFILDIQIPRHIGGPFMNRLTGGYLLRSGSRNLPIDPGMLRSRFVDELQWLHQTAEMTSQAEAALASSGRVASGQALSVGILPQQHFDHLRAPFEQDDVVRMTAPAYHRLSRDTFRACGDGHEVLLKDARAAGIERLHVRDDWFVHAHIAYALQERQGEGSLAMGEFEDDVPRYLGDIAAFFTGQEIEGPFAVTLALLTLNENDHFATWFRGIPAIRTVRPQIVAAVDDEDMIAGFLRRVRQASVYGY